jgi:hypothetical protein
VTLGVGATLVGLCGCGEDQAASRGTDVAAAVKVLSTEVRVPLPWLFRDKGATKNGAYVVDLLHDLDDYAWNGYAATSDPAVEAAILAVLKEAHLCRGGVHEADPDKDYDRLYEAKDKASQAQTADDWSAVKTDLMHGHD